MARGRDPEPGQGPQTADSVPGIRFQHVITGLAGLAAASAFVFPQYTTPRRAHLEGLVAPIARPAAAVAQRIRQRVAPELTPDARAAEDIHAENARLRTELDYLSDQVARLIELNRDRERMGQVRHLCTAIAVEGSDASGVRQTLSLTGSPEGLRAGLPVLYPRGIVGQVESVGLAGFRVRLLTDPGFRVLGRFRRISPSEGGQVRSDLLQLPPAVVEGVGRNAMVVRTLPKSDVDGELKIGDMITLADNTWDEALQGYRLGRVVSIGTLRDAPLTAEIRIEPEATLTQLRDVLVMTRPATAARTPGGSP